MSKTINMELPWPPSVNNYWKVDRKTKRYYLTREAVQFRQDAIILTRMQLGKYSQYRALDGFVSCKMLYVPPRNVGDIDNYSKGIFDSLKHAKVILDDKQVKHLEIFWHLASKPGFVRLALTPIEWPRDEWAALFAKAASNGV